MARKFEQLKAAFYDDASSAGTPSKVDNSQLNETLQQVSNLRQFVSSHFIKLNTELAVMRREASLQAEQVLRFTKQQKAMQYKIIPSVQKLFICDLQYLQ